MERKVDDRLHLSRESMVKSGAPIVVLDAHDSIYVYYTAAARADVDACPFPPPHSSALRIEVERLRRSNVHLTPKVREDMPLRMPLHMRVGGGVHSFIRVLSLLVSVYEHCAREQCPPL